MKVEKLSLKEIGEYYETAHFVRPIRAEVVDDYARLMKDGNTPPAMILGVYTGAEDKPCKLIVDGVHTYRAAQIAKVESLACEIHTYATLADALAEQLQRNLHHGLRVTISERDFRIHKLVELFNWRQEAIAKAVGLSQGSVSRILRKPKTAVVNGKPGRKTGKAPAAVLAHALPPVVFFRAIQNIELTVSKVNSKKQILAAMQDPKYVRNIPRLVTVLKHVVNEFQHLLKAAVKVVEVEKEIGVAVRRA